MTALELMDALGETEEELLWPCLAAPARRSPRRVLRAALIAAAVLVLLALAALAASESGLLERIFPHRYDLIADYVSHVEAVAENETLRLTLHEAVTDGTCALMVFSVERLDGGSMKGWSPDAVITPLDSQGIPIVNRASTVRTYLYDGAGRTCFLWTSLGGTDLARVSLRLLGLKDMSTYARLDGGSLTAEAAMKPCPVKIGERGVSPSGEELFVSIVISPLSVRVVSYPNLSGMTPENASLPDSVRDGQVKYKAELLLRDGSRQDISGILYRKVESASTGRVAFTGSFPELLDIGSVKAIVFDGVEYRLSNGEAPRPRGRWVEGMASLEYLRSRTFGEHTPVYPALRDDAEQVSLALEGIWTDGYTTELLLEITAERSMEVLSLVQEGGWITFDARDRKGEALAVGVLSNNMADGLLGLVVECAGKASELTIGDGDASLTIPLDMKKLSKLPRVEPREPQPLPTADPAAQAENRQARFDSLFEGVTPVNADITGDNGVYEITVTHLWLAEGRFRAWVLTRRLDGEKDEAVSLSEFQAYLLSDGAELRMAEGISVSGWIEGPERHLGLRVDYRPEDYPSVDGLRLIWTPPEGARITLDLPMTG